MNKAVHVALASDEGYFPYIYVAVQTLFEQNQEVDEIVVHYIEQDVSEKYKNHLLELGKIYGREVDIIPFSIPEQFKKTLPTFGASQTTYIKFWFGTMFPTLDRILYLDPDILVMDNIERLYNTEFNGNLIAAVIENLPTYHRDASKMEENDSYINGGMVLFNLDLWRKENMEFFALERTKDTSLNLNYDQGILNEICANRILVFPPKYAVLAEVFEFADAEKIKKRYGFDYYYSQEEIDEAITHPVIIHFTGFLYGKPLNVNCTHPYANYFQKKLKAAPFEWKLKTDDFPLKIKIRRFFLHNMSFSLYLKLETFLDIHRKKAIGR